MNTAIHNRLTALCAKPISQCENKELYSALLKLVQQEADMHLQPVTGRKLYYISAEFLIGKLLSNNLINLGIYEDVRACLAENGKSLAEIEEIEAEPSLGNGGLGRLAACFLDSLATLNLPGDGIGLRYHCGLFRQQFKNELQHEMPDTWLSDDCWTVRTQKTYPVQLAGKTYNARLHQLSVTGYEGRTNMLNLFDLDSIDEAIISEGIAFDKEQILPMPCGLLLSVRMSAKKMGYLFLFSRRVLLITSMRSSSSSFLSSSMADCSNTGLSEVSLKN